MNVNNLIARHAYITAGIQRDRISRRQTPPHILAEHQRIEAKAQAMFSPMELQQAQAASQSMQAQYLQQHDIQSAQQDANETGYYREQLSKDLTGMTPDQLEYAKQGKPIPVKGQQTGKAAYRSNLEGLIKHGGLKISHDAFLRTADRVEELQGAGKDIKPYLQKKFGKQSEYAENLIGGYHRSGIGIESALVGDSQKDYFVQADEDMQRRSTLADSFAHSAMRNTEDREFITERIDPTYLEHQSDDDSRADIANAFMDSEHKQESEDRASYQSPSYDIEETEEVRYANF